MNENHKRITGAADLMDWNKRFDLEISMKEKQAGIIMDYLKKHGASLAYDEGGTLFWVEADKETIELSLDDVIDQVCEWNFDEVCRAKSSRMEADSYLDYCKLDDKYKKLLKEYRSLEKAFEQTSYGKDIAIRMRKLAAKTYEQTRLVPVYNLPQVDDKVFMPAAQEPKKAYAPQKGQVI